MLICVLVVMEKKMNIKLGSIVTIFLIFVFGWLGVVQAQQSSPKATPCQQLAKEILSEIDIVYDLSLASDKVLVAGEVYESQLLANEKQLSLTQSLAIVGGLSRNARRSVYLLRQIVDGEARTVLEIDLREIKMGRTKDLLLKNGDVVFVPRRCSNGKIVPFTDNPDKTTGLIDTPVRLYEVSFPEKRPKDE